MKRYIIFYFIVLFIISGANLFAQNITVSGILDSSVSIRAGAGDSPAFSYGVEEYANLRFQSRIRDRAVIYGAVNLIAASGDYAANALAMFAGDSPISTTAFIGGENYIAAIELERLYFRLNWEYTNLDGGLFRLPFGYGQVWGPSDFLNPKNPLKPDARPRAILGTAFSWYPTDEIKLLAFFAAPRIPFAHNGTLFGLSIDRHWDMASVQALYSFETPKTGSAQGIHRAGLSIKADIEAGFVMDALYSYNREAGTGINGLSFSIGADYSFFGGDLIVLAEYLYSGDISSSSRNGGGSFSNNNYLYTGLTWRFNDFTNIGFALISCFDDVSFTPVFTFNHDLFQGAALTVTAQIPLDRDLFSANGKRGELGPIPPGYNMGRYFDLSARLRLRF
jgi:hypothetical protein